MEKGTRNRIIISVVAGVLVLATVVAGFMLVGDDSTTSEAVAAPTETETTTETQSETPEAEEPFEGLVIGPDGIEGVGSFGDPLEDVISKLEALLGSGTRDEPGYETDGMWWGTHDVGYASVSGWYDTGYQLPARSFIEMYFQGSDVPIAVRTTTGITIGSSEADLFLAYESLSVDDWSAPQAECVPATFGGSEGLPPSSSENPTLRRLHTTDRVIFEVEHGVVISIRISGDLTGNTGICERAWFGIE